MRHVDVAIEARADISDILFWSEARFGPRTADRYRRLIEAGFASLLEDPARPGVQQIPELGEGVRLYSLRHCRRQLPPSERIGKPRHVLVFSVDGEVVRVARVLHEASDIPARLSAV